MEKDSGELFKAIWKREEYNTIEPRIKEPTFLGNSLLKDVIFAFSIHIFRDGGSVSLIKKHAEIV